MLPFAKYSLWFFNNSILIGIGCGFFLLLFLRCFRLTHFGFLDGHKLWWLIIVLISRDLNFLDPFRQFHLAFALFPLVLTFFHLKLAFLFHVAIIAL